MYQWICEKCGEDNRSSQNICKNAACKWVFHQTREQVVTCAKCKTAPIGNMLYRKGRNTTFPLKRLSFTELHHPDYEVYGPAGRKFLEGLKSFVGKYLCQGCHPATLGLKIDSSLGSEYENVDPAVHQRISDDRKAYDRVAASLKVKLGKIRSANPEMTPQEEIELARRLIRKVKDDEFIVDQLDWQLRRIVRGAIVSKVSLRKNIDKNRIYEKLYRYWRIEEARQRRDMSHLKKVLREEAKRASELGSEVIDDARKGPDLFSTIEQLTQLMSDKSDEIALREHRIQKEADVAYDLDFRMKVLHDRILKLRGAMTWAKDPEYMARLGTILTRLHTQYTRMTERAQQFLTPIGIEMERELIKKMQRRFFTHYAPLLNVTRNIILWDVDEDMWTGHIGKPSKSGVVLKDSDGFGYGNESLSDEERKRRGFFSYFNPTISRDKVYFGKPGAKERPSQEVTFIGRPFVNERPEDKQEGDKAIKANPGNEYETVVSTLALSAVYSTSRCEVCDRFTTNPKMLFGIDAVRRIDILTGSDMPPKVDDFMSRADAKAISKDDRKMITRMDLVVCPDCHDASNLSDIAKAQAERRRMLQAEWQVKANEQTQERLRTEVTRKHAAEHFRIWVMDGVHAAHQDIVNLGVVYAAPVVKIDSRPGKSTELVLVAVPKYGVELPSSILHHGCEVKIQSTSESFFPMTYVYCYLSYKESAQWKRAATLRAMKLTPFGLAGDWNGVIGNLTQVASKLQQVIPPLPMGYWIGVHRTSGIREVHVNFRELVLKGSAFDFEPMYPYGKPTEAELQRLKAIQMDRSRRRSEEKKFWDPLRTRGKGGPSPKTIPKHRRPPAREDRRGFHTETPMPLLPGSDERIRQTPVKGKLVNKEFSLTGFPVVDPATKDTTDFLMLPPPATPQRGTRHWISVEQDKEFYRQKSADRGREGKDAEFCKKVKAECDAKLKKFDKKTYQHVKLPKK